MNKIVSDAVIFDLDGTLIDSMNNYFRSLEIAFKKLGLPLPSRKAVSDAVKDGDFNWDSVLPTTIGMLKDVLIAEVRTLIEKSMSKHELKLIPGVSGVLKEISAKGMKIGLVTSTLKKNMPDKLYPIKKAGIEDLLEVIITIDDAQRKKPAADPLIECAKRLGADVDKCIYVGDSRVDIRAGRAAGMKAIGVLTGLDDYETLMMEGPDLILDSVAQLGDVIKGYVRL